MSAPAIPLNTPAKPHNCSYFSSGNYILSPKHPPEFQYDRWWINRQESYVERMWKYIYCCERCGGGGYSTPYTEAIRHWCPFCHWNNCFFKTGEVLAEHREGWVNAVAYHPHPEFGGIVPQHYPKYEVVKNYNVQYRCTHCGRDGQWLVPENGPGHTEFVAMRPAEG